MSTATAPATQWSEPRVAPVNPVQTVDFSNPDTFAAGHPYEEFRRLREIAPVFWNPEVVPARGFWALTRYADIVHVSNKPDLFCNKFGYKSVDDHYARISGPAADAMGRILPHLDPPDHDVIKRVFQPYFTPKAVKELEDSVRSKAIALMDGLKGKTDIEVVSALNVHLPIQVLADLLGVPEDDRAKLLYWTDGIFGADDPEYFSKPTDAGARFAEMFEYGRAAIDQRRANPTGDLLSAIANVQLNGEYLERSQVDGVLAMFIGAGNETTRNVITASLYQLWKHPEARRELVNDPSLIPNATDELLRFITPANHMRRTATADTEVGGQPIAKGDKLVMFYAAANRDPEMFPDPDRFDIRRANAKRHLAFGLGIHRCIGAVLAQLELKIFLEVFLPRYPNYVVTSEPTLLRHNFVYAIKTMGLRLA
jgi:cholest-4-en-3-one 26-monooxygenase